MGGYTLYFLACFGREIFYLITEYIRYLYSVPQLIYEIISTNTFRVALR